MIVAYPELVGEMAKRKLIRTSITKKLGISTCTLCSQMAGETDFTLFEANTIQKSFFGCGYGVPIYLRRPDPGQRMKKPRQV